jgi:hypothetical protein
MSASSGCNKTYVHCDGRLEHECKFIQNLGATNFIELHINIAPSLPQWQACLCKSLAIFIIAKIVYMFCDYMCFG